MRKLLHQQAISQKTSEVYINEKINECQLEQQQLTSVMVQVLCKPPLQTFLQMCGASRQQGTASGLCGAGLPQLPHKVSSSSMPRVHASDKYTGAHLGITVILTTTALLSRKVS